MNLLAPIHMARTRKRWTYATWCGLDSELLNQNAWSSWRERPKHEAKSIYSWKTATCFVCLEKYLQSMKEELYGLENRIEALKQESIGKAAE